MELLQRHRFRILPPSRIPGDWAGNVCLISSFSLVFFLTRTLCSEDPFNYDLNDLGMARPLCQLSFGLKATYRPRPLLPRRATRAVRNHRCESLTFAETVLCHSLSGSIPHPTQTPRITFTGTGTSRSRQATADPRKTLWMRLGTHTSATRASSTCSVPCSGTGAMSRTVPSRSIKWTFFACAALFISQGPGRVHPGLYLLAWFGGVGWRWRFHCLNFCFRRVDTHSCILSRKLYALHLIIFHSDSRHYVVQASDVA